MAAGIAMIKGADSADQLAKQITGTNSAVAQANIVMSSYEERSKRNKAVLEDLKIAFFDVTQSIAPYIQNTLGAISSVGELASTGNSLYSVYESRLLPKTWGWIKSLFVSTGATTANSVATASNTIATNANSSSKGLGAMLARIYRGELFGISATDDHWRGNFKNLHYRHEWCDRGVWIASLSVKTFSTAILNIPVIGWIIAAVVALIAVFKYLWDHSKRFREILFGIWEAAKLSFII
ncbi:hypothetical protein E5F92_009410 [Flavobacterium columnare]|uniref:hypothetical protein n=1 Tax=Flavobacterium columnare TaxID=996 RepID=UPI002989E5C7|nr:hypothetical protein [Flavobacterium columnare]MCH4832880.1 hypothetical protein [Flavobacterium columnare]